MITSVFTFLAILISASSLFIILWDRFPRAHITIGKAVETEDTEYGIAKIGERLWVTISNRSAKRIFITDIYVEWSKYIILPTKVHKVILKDLERWESDDKPEATRRFWVEPWGDVVLSADAEELEYGFKKQIISSRSKISYRVVVCDGLRKQYKSNRIKLIDPNIKLLRSIIRK